MHRLRSIPLAALVALCAVAGVAPSGGTQPRPELPAGADPNDWESYFTEGERLFTRFPSGAEAAFVWAARLDPTRAEPLMARWATFYARDQGLWINYLNDDERTLRRPDVITNESNLLLAQVRNPFVHRGLEAALLSMLGRRLLWNRATEAFMAYGRADFRRAAADFGRLIRANPRRNFRLRHFRALSLVGDGQLDSAAVEIEQLLTVLRRTDEREVGEAYQSRAMWEHALGLVYASRGDSVRARRAYERALEEDLSYYAARMGLARLDTRARDDSAAAAHLAHAVEIAPGDGVVRLEYGNALMNLGRPREALEQYQAAREREPHWAEVYLRLGRAHDVLGETALAVEAYRGYLERAPRKQVQDIETISERLAVLQPAP